MLSRNLGQIHAETPEADSDWSTYLMEYKVLTARDARYSGSFDSESLEATLNTFAAEGWRVISAFTASSVWKSTKSEIMIVLERSAA